MNSPLYRENSVKGLENLFGDLQDDILDGYNKGDVTGIEMRNIMRWCERMKKNMIKDIKDGKYNY